MQWYEDEVRALEERLASRPTGQVVFYGSSSFTLWTALEQRLPGVVNAGFGGSTLQACAWFLERLLVPLRPRHLVLYVGDNDLGDGADRATMVKRTADLLTTIDFCLPGIPITWLTTKPSPARWGLQALIQASNGDLAGALARRGRSLLVDVHQPMLGDDGHPLPELYTPDGLHLSSAGYAVWLAALLAHQSWWAGAR